MGAMGDILDVVHGGDGILRVTLLGVSHKTKAAAATSVAVLDDDLLRRRSVRHCVPQEQRGRMNQMHQGNTTGIGGRMGRGK